MGKNRPAPGYLFPLLMGVKFGSYPYKLTWSEKQGLIPGRDCFLTMFRLLMFTTMTANLIKHLFKYHDS